MGFKQLPFEWRERTLKDLKGARLAVWLIHYWRSDREDQVEIANAQIMRDCNLGLSTVKLAKAWLKENGWLLVRADSYRNAEGEWRVPKISAVYPGLETNPRTGVGNQPSDPGLHFTPPPGVGFPPAVKPTPSVHTGFAGVNTERG